MYKEPNSSLLGLLLVFLLPLTAAAGVQINRYEPTTAGESSFMVDRPWYSAPPSYSAGLTLNYGHDPLKLGEYTASGALLPIRPIIAHQLLGHLDLAASFKERFTLSASLPITLLERGNAANGLAPIGSLGVGDPRIGALVRLHGDLEKDRFSVHAGLNLWAPFGKSGLGDEGMRIQPKVIVGGAGEKVLWSAVASFYARPKMVIGQNLSGDGGRIGSEVSLGASVAYANPERTFSVGPELLASTVVIGNEAFTSASSRLELLLGAHYNFTPALKLGLAVGSSAFSQIGTPDFRGLLRFAWSPQPELALPPPPRLDLDGDGLFDDEDACPNEAEDADGFEDHDGCPDPDNDQDGVPDTEDTCPLVAGDVRYAGCPIPDTDGDGLLDPDDACIEEAGPMENHGCPWGDTDGDGLSDDVDACPQAAEDIDGFEDGDGCPDIDNDQDGVADSADKCPNEAGPPENRGCPDQDRDGDTVVDRLDNCPDEAGDPANFGCKVKQLARIVEKRIEILDAVYFATNKDVIEKRSYPLLKDVANILKSHPEIRVRVEGHTDSQGQLAANMKLSDRRAASVRRFLIAEGIDENRLESAGYGPTQPIDTNKTAAGRAKNRRVVFSILENANAESGVEVQDGKPVQETK